MFLELLFRKNRKKSMKHLRQSQGEQNINKRNKMGSEPVFHPKKENELQRASNPKKSEKNRKNKNLKKRGETPNKGSVAKNSLDFIVQSKVNSKKRKKKDAVNPQKPRIKESKFRGQKKHSRKVRFDI